MADKLTFISSAEAPAAIGPYSQAVAANGFLFASGQIPLDPVTGEITGETTAEQAKQVLSNVKAVLNGAGLEMKDVVKATVFLVDLADFADVNSIYTEAFGDHKPARSTFQVAGLPKGARVEIEIVAALG